ncbi:DUF1643 domain-containing protein [Sphingomonas aerolata]|uniref:DUF1643 domain-containing protein n=1 Tax=Sphingomonas aerolata TaxID=185951 RepID=UPI002FE2822B
MPRAAFICRNGCGRFQSQLHAGFGPCSGLSPTYEKPPSPSSVWSQHDRASDTERGASVPRGTFRYWLARQRMDGAPRLPIIMLNLSTADAENDDPTIRRCIAFARREGFGGIHVFNLFAFRATSPDDMRAAADPVGPLNDHWFGQTPKSAA